MPGTPAASSSLSSSTGEAETSSRTLSPPNGSKNRDKVPSSSLSIVQRVKRSQSVSTDNGGPALASSNDAVERRKVDKKDKARKRDGRRRSVISGLTPFSSKRDSPEGKSTADDKKPALTSGASFSSPPPASSLSSLPLISVYGTEVKPMGPIFTLGLFHGGLAFTDIERFSAKYATRKHKPLVAYLRERNSIFPQNLTSPTEASGITTSAVVVACGANSIAVLCTLPLGSATCRIVSLPFQLTRLMLSSCCLLCLLLVLHIAQDDLFMSGAESLPRICLGQSDKKTQQGDGHWHLVKLPSTEHITHVAVGASHSLAVTGTVLLE